MEKVVRSLEEFNAEAGEFARALRARAPRATLITLSGELGAGKTAFVKAVAKALGVADIVNSPTFVLEKVYALPPGAAFSRIIHIDAYRLEKGADLSPLRFDELMKDSRNLIFFEWPERVGGMLPSPASAIALASHPDGSRTISYG